MIMKTKSMSNGGRITHTGGSNRLSKKVSARATTSGSNRLTKRTRTQTGQTVINSGFPKIKRTPVAMLLLAFLAEVTNAGLLLKIDREGLFGFHGEGNCHVTMKYTPVGNPIEVTFVHKPDGKIKDPKTVTASRVLWSHLETVNVLVGKFNPGYNSRGPYPLKSVKIINDTTGNPSNKSKTLGVKFTIPKAQGTLCWLQCDREDTFAVKAMRDFVKAVNAAHETRFIIPKGSPRQDIKVPYVEKIRKRIRQRARSRKRANSAERGKKLSQNGRDIFQGLQGEIANAIALGAKGLQNKFNDITTWNTIGFEVKKPKGAQSNSKPPKRVYTWSYNNGFITLKKSEEEGTWVELTKNVISSRRKYVGVWRDYLKVLLGEATGLPLTCFDFKSKTVKYPYRFFDLVLGAGRANQLDGTAPFKVRVRNRGIRVKIQKMEARVKRMRSQS